jgi:hypothetical protein
MSYGVRAHAVLSVSLVICHCTGKTACLRATAAERPFLPAVRLHATVIQLLRRLRTLVLNYELRKTMCLGSVRVNMFRTFTEAYV